MVMGKMTDKLRKDCFAYNDKGYCDALTGQNCESCAFYKTFEKNDAERERCVRRLRRIGRQDLIEKYGSFV